MTLSGSSKPLIVLFAKAPAPGRVKTRLQPFLTPPQSAELHSAMAGDALEMLSGITDLADIEIHTDRPTAEWSEFAMPRRQQPEGGLGRRLLVTLETGLELGRPRVLILGSDSPGLPAAHVRHLLTCSADVTFGPTEDGGFYGICARRSAPAMLDKVRWSSSSTLAGAITAVRKCGLSAEVGNRWFDIDEPSDLLKLSTTAPLGRRLRDWLTRFPLNWGALESDRGLLA